MVLDVHTGLSAFQSATESREHIWIPTAIEEEALILAQAHQVQAGFEEMSVPIVG